MRKKCTSFCDSHTIPRFIIKNISEKGKVYSPIMAIDDIEVKIREKVFKGHLGINETLLFENICRECDNNYFNCVENEEILQGKLNDRILTLYALKILLHEQYIKTLNVNTINIGLAKNNIENVLPLPLIVDVFEASKEIQDYKSAIDNKTNIKHKVILDTIINRTVNFCTTCQITPGNSYKGKYLNDMFTYSKMLGGIFVLVLPLKCNKTRVIVYYRRKYANYNIINEEFQQMELKDKLQAISNLLIIYSEEIVFTEAVLNHIKPAKNIIAYNIVDDSNPKTCLDFINFLNDKEINMFEV